MAKSSNLILGIVAGAAIVGIAAYLYINKSAISAQAVAQPTYPAYPYPYTYPYVVDPSHGHGGHGHRGGGP
jgi:hypothetical protein